MGHIGEPEAFYGPKGRQKPPKFSISAELEMLNSRRREAGDGRQTIALRKLIFQKRAGLKTALEVILLTFNL